MLKHLASLVSAIGLALVCLSPTDASAQSEWDAAAPPPPPPPPISRPMRPDTAPVPEPAPAPAPAPEAPPPAPAEPAPPPVEETPDPPVDIPAAPVTGPEPDVFEDPGTNPEGAPSGKTGDADAPSRGGGKETIVVPPTVGTEEDVTAVPGDEAAEPVPFKFIKGDLIYPGTRRLLSRYDHVGVSLGGNIIDNALFVSVSPGMAWYFDFGLAISAHVPLNLKAVAVNGTDFEFGEMKIRREDWDEVSDFAKIVRFISYGRKEDNIYATINTMRPMTLGHGMVLNRYQGDIDVDRSLTSIIFDAYNQYAGVQLKANDVTFQNAVVGGLAFVKPLSFFTDNVYAQSLSLGGEFVADFMAPRCVVTNQPGEDLDNPPCVQGSGQAAGPGEYDGVEQDLTYARTDKATGRYKTLNTEVMAAGGSVEFKFYKDERNVDLKAYSTFHYFLNPGGGWGLAGGVLARLNAGEYWRSAFRIRAEYRTFTDGFLPNYFDTLYEIQKYAYLYRGRDHQAATTKYQYVFGDPDNGFERVDHGQRHGFNVEAHWTLFQGSRSEKRLGIGIGLQDAYAELNDPQDDLHFYAHVEANLWSWVQIFGTYMRTNVKGFDTMFDTMLSQNAMLLTGVRIKVLPILFINAHYSRSFRVTRSPESEYHLGNDNIVDFYGNTTDVPQSRLHENVQTLFVEVEFGWEFDDDDEEEAEEPPPDPDEMDPMYPMGEEAEDA